ncbi:MAG: hypothetical protein QW394_09750 [Thermofilaceae archaeon]
MEKEYELFDHPCPTCAQTTFTLPLRPKITHRVICPKCKTVSILHITSEIAIRVYTLEEYERAKCKKCNGTGKCPTCKGTGKTVCPKCRGYGYYTDAEGFFGEWTITHHGCTYCGGSGKSENIEKIRRGSGKVECRECNGTGVCPECGGEGLLL